MDEQKELDLIAEAKKAYYKEYRRKNKERIRANNERYWLNRAVSELKALAPEEDQQRGVKTV